MKKQYQIISAFIALAMLFSGCAGDAVQSDTELNKDETTASVDLNVGITASETETAAEESKTVGTAAENDQNENITEFNSDKYPENTFTAEFPVADIDMSNYTGNFYKWEYDTDIISENEEDFSAEEVKAAHDEAQRYFMELLEGAEGKENLDGSGSGGVLIELEMQGHNRYWQYRIYEDDYIKCINGECDIEFFMGVRKDFDGNGEEESFFMFQKTPYLNTPIVFTVFVNAKGEACALKNAGLLSGSFYPVIYNGFTHMAVSSGYNNSTLCTKIYAVENGEAVLKLTEFSRPKNYMDVFMKVYMAQRSGDWLVFWNEEINEYCSLAGDPITDVEAEELFEAYNQNGFGTDESAYKTAEAIKNNTRKFGNVYCIATDYGSYYPFFEKVENGFTVSENRISPADEEFTEIYASGLDFGSIAEKTIDLS